jgi:hypothetical protein
VTAIDIDDHHKKRKISSECAPKWTPEEATLPLCTNLTELPTTSAELYATFFRTPPEHVTPLFNHHIKAVIRDGTLVLPGTPPGTNSPRPPGISASAHTDENAIIHGDELNCPAPADGIGPMSERDPNAENAVDLNFNDNISDNGLTVVNMSATTSTYSLCSENSRNCVHLYAPQLTRAFDTTHTSTTNGTRTKPMTEIFINNFQDKDAEFPTTSSPPTTHDPLETTILAQRQTKSRPTHADTTKRHYEDARNYDSSADTDTDIIRLPPPGHQKLHCHRHREKQTYPFFNPASIFKQQDSSSYQLQPTLFHPNF